MKVNCEFCGFRGFPANVKLHQLRHTRPEPKPNTPEPKSASEEPETTPNGRVKRHAASKANLKVANAIKQLKTGQF
jgi:hypothetical protein